MTGGIAALLMAGGRARRFGSDKLMHPLPGGEPMVLASLEKLKRGGAERCLVLVPPGRPTLVRILKEAGAPLRVCEEAPQGMGRTLACGVAATRDAAGWLVALGDMPFLKPETIASVIGRLRGGAPLAVPRYQGERGHPVGFAAEFGHALENLDSDAGARHILRANPERIHWLDVDDPGILSDVDTPADLPIS
jgi:molybdenum cofactor cytidylyltransferase